MLRTIIKFFEECPKCKVQYLIVYDNGDTECTYCGYSSEERKK